METSSKIYLHGKYGKGKYTLVDKNDFNKLNKYKWHCHNGYAVRSQWISGKSKMIFMHRLINKTPKGFETDHVNRDRLDNRRENLRMCTRSQNARNQNIKVTNTSGYKGIYWNREKKLWQSQIRNENKKVIYLGRFSTKEGAAIAYNLSVSKIASEFAVLNKLKGGYNFVG